MSKSSIYGGVDFVVKKDSNNLQWDWIPGKDDLPTEEEVGLRTSVMCIKGKMEPTKYYLPVLDRKLFKKGDNIAIENMSGKLETRKIKNIEKSNIFNAHVIHLDNPMAINPKDGGRVYRIKARNNTIGKAL